MLQFLVRSKVSRVAGEVVGCARVEEPEGTRHFSAVGHFSLIVHPSCHQEKPTVPFITIDHYISLFVTFVAISAIIALWHP